VPQESGVVNWLYELLDKGTVGCPLDQAGGGVLRLRRKINAERSQPSGSF
jgi:hypothetical protein